MIYDIDEIDKISRKVMGFSRDDVLDYNEVVLKYASLLSMYATNLPVNEFLNLDFKEKAFVIASIQLRVEDEKREAAKIKKK